MEVGGEGSFEKKRIGVLVVAYNAASTLAKVLDRIPTELRPEIEEVIVSDDHSQDSTYLVGLGYKQESDLPITLIRQAQNLGYGGNQKAGYRLAIEHGLDIVVMLHGAGQYAPRHHAEHRTGNAEQQRLCQEQRKDGCPACAESARRSAKSPLSTAPPGSATATTKASTADPRPADARSSAARRASCCGTSSMISQVFRKRLVRTSLRSLPLRHSTRTTEGTRGGQMPSRTKAAIMAAVSWLRRAKRVTAPEASTSAFMRHDGRYGRGAPARRACLPWP